MRNIKKKLEAFTRLILAVTVFVTSFGYLPFVSAAEYTKGDIIDPVNSAGGTQNEGEVALEKSVSKTDEEGVYTVTLKTKGKNKVITESQTGSIYTVVVLDTSGSMTMNCNAYGSCYGSNTEKYDNAKAGAKSFATNLLSKYSSSQIALVTFASNVYLARNFENIDFSDVSFPRANGGTNLGSAIKKAAELLVAKKNVDSNAKLYMVVLSDGYPDGQTVNHTTAANYAKGEGIEIFTIGYATTSATEELLKGVATDDSHFKKADTSNIADMFNDVLGDIKIPLNAGTDAIISDVIADGFTYVEGSASTTATVDGQNISFNIGNITEKGTIVSFKIKANKDLEDGLHRTNDFAKVEYTNIDNISDKVEISESSKIYWEQDKYTYTVNYKEQGTDKVLSDQKVVTDAVYGRSYSEIAKDVTGYNVVGESTQDILVSEDNQEITFYYTKKTDLSYTVEYYLDNLNNKFGLENFNNQTFGDEIEASEVDVNKYLQPGYQDGVIVTEMPYTIIDGQNIIQVLYQKREDMTYTVKYLDKETNESILDTEVRTGKKYLETYTEAAKEAPFGYVLVSETTKDVLINEDNKTVTFYYKKRNDMNYTVNYKEQDTEKELAESKVVNNAVYNETYQETAKEIKGYNVVGESTQNIKIDEDNKTITFYYTKKSNLLYTVEYYLDNLDNKLGYEDFNNQTFGDEIEANEVDVNKYLQFGYQDGVIITEMPYTIIDGQNIIQVLYQKREDMTYTVKYLDKETNESILDEEVRTGKKYLETYTETAKEAPFGYVLVSETTKDILVNENNKTVTFYYEKRNDMNYTVNYKEQDTEKELADSKVVNDAVYNRTYQETAKKIKGYNVVGESTQNIKTDEDNKTITFYYTKKNNLTYRVEYYYDGIIDSSKTEYFDNMTYGQIIDTYEEKMPVGYKFVSDTGAITIDDETENVIKVYYETEVIEEIQAPKTGVESETGLSYLSLIIIIGLGLTLKKVTE